MEKSLIVSENERKDITQTLSEHPDLQHLMTSHEDLLHVLKVISRLQPHERFSTYSGIHLHVYSANDSWSWLKRLLLRENRSYNLQIIKTIFIISFIVADQFLQQREELLKIQVSPRHRPHIIQTMKNTQMMERIIKGIQEAQQGLQVLKTTYENDTTTEARIDMIGEFVSDRIKLVQTSLHLLSIPLENQLQHQNTQCLEFHP